jgi:molybdate transport system substrate-binding protein
MEPLVPVLFSSRHVASVPSRCLPFPPLFRAALAVGLALASACKRQEPAPSQPAAPSGVAATSDLRIAAAASLKELLAAADAKFEAAHAGAKCVVTLDASSTLSRQIESGAPHDVFLSADAANLDRLGDRVVATTRVEFLGNELVVVARDGLAPVPASAADLAKLPGKLALAGEAVPAGKYARAWLKKAGQLDAVQPKVVNGDDVRATLALVESGAADAAVVYVTDARIARSAKIAFHVPKAEDPGVVYVAVAVAASKQPLAAEYVKWLRSSEFQQEAAKLGFKTGTP